MAGLIKKVVLTTMLGALPVLALANGYYKDAPVYPVYKDRAPSMPGSGSWYVGAQAGYDVYSADQHVSETATPGDSASPTIAAGGFAIGLFGGYGYDFDPYYLAAEANVAASNADSSWRTSLDSTNAFTSKFDANWGVGINILPGIDINETTKAFLKLGYNWVNVSQDDSGSGNSGGNRATVRGMSYGLGMETLFNENWGLRLDYTYFNLGSLNHTVANEVNSKISVANNQVMLGLDYHIA